MRVVIVDDEPLARSLLRSHLSGHADIEVVDEAASGAGAIARVLEHLPDAVFLDIEMGDRGGISAAIDIVPLGTEIVLVTAHEHYAVSAFELGVADYILKPLSKERLGVALDRLRARLAAHHQLGTTSAPQPSIADQSGGTVWVSTRKGLVQVHWCDIERIEAARDHVFLHTRNHAYMHRATMASLEGPATASGLIRIHRSAFIHERAIRLIRRRGRSLIVEATDGALIPVGQSYKATVMAIFGPRIAAHGRA